MPDACGNDHVFQNLGRPISDYEVYRHEISMADLAEPLGFDSIWGAEHHFDDYTMCPTWRNSSPIWRGVRRG